MIYRYLIHGVRRARLQAKRSIRISTVRLRKVIYRYLIHGVRRARLQFVQRGFFAGVRFLDVIMIRDFPTPIGFATRKGQSSQKNRAILGSLEIPRGNEKFASKWESSNSDKRILFIADSDYSGSFMKWASALNENSEYAVRMITLKKHNYGYLDDVCLERQIYSTYQTKEIIKHFLKRSGLVHLKDEIGIFLGRNVLSEMSLIVPDKPTLFTLYGGYARKYSSDKKFKRLVNSFTHVTVMTPDLGFPWIKNCDLVPHSIEMSSTVEPSWKFGKKWCHSPSSAERKGTREFLQAYQNLESSFGLELDLIQGVPHSVCLERKNATNWFFDQAGREIPEKLGINTEIGWYGNSALEATSRGIPTLANISSWAIESVEKLWPELGLGLPVINCGNDIDTIQNTMEMLMLLTEDEATSLSVKTLEATHRFHSNESISKRLVDLYERYF